MRIVVRLEWKMKRSSEVSWEMERASGSNKMLLLFGRNLWINVQYRLTKRLGGRAARCRATNPPFLLPLTEKTSLPGSFPLVFTFSCVAANKSQMEPRINAAPILVMEFKPYSLSRMMGAQRQPKPANPPSIQGI
jgi:hypothetical protein